MNASLATVRLQASRLVGSEAARGAALSFGLKLAGSALNIVMLTLIARSMDAHEFGVFALWFNALLFLAVVSCLGQEKLILRSWNEYLSGQEYGLARGALRFGALVTAAGAVAAAAAVTIAGSVQGAAGTLVASAAVFAILQTLYSYNSHVNRAVVGIVGADGHEVTWRGLVSVGAAVALLAGWRLQAGHVFVLASAGMGLAVLVQIVTARRGTPPRVRTAPVRMDVRTWWARSAKMTAAGFLEAAVEFLEVILVGIILSPAAAGGYFVAARLANAFAMIGGGLHSFSTRQISKQHFGEGSEAVADTLRKLGIFTALVVAAGALAIVVAGPQILAVFGRSFVDQYPILLLLSLGTAFVTLAGPAPTVLLVTGHEGLYSLVVGAGLVCRIALIVVCATLFGATGAAAASAAVSIGTAIALNAACRKRAGLDPAITILLPGRKAKT